MLVDFSIKSGTKLIHTPFLVAVSAFAYYPDIPHFITLLFWAVLSIQPALHSAEQLCLVNKIHHYAETIAPISRIRTELLLNPKQTIWIFGQSRFVGTECIRGAFFVDGFHSELVRLSFLQTIDLAFRVFRFAHWHPTA